MRGGILLLILVEHVWGVAMRKRGCAIDMIRLSVMSLGYMVIEVWKSNSVILPISLSNRCKTAQYKERT
jgi:hypothetical protein